eukprot:4617655-Pyramimonas_sp.AAC.1
MSWSCHAGAQNAGATQSRPVDVRRRSEQAKAQPMAHPTNGATCGAIPWLVAQPMAPPSDCAVSGPSGWRTR